jgi:hypothetical protein
MVTKGAWNLLLATLNSGKQAVYQKWGISKAEGDDLACKPVPTRQSGFGASPLTARRRSLTAMQDGSAISRDAKKMRGTERRARKSDESECVIENGRIRAM